MLRSFWSGVCSCLAIFRRADRDVDETGGDVDREEHHGAECLHHDCVTTAAARHRVQPAIAAAVLVVTVGGLLATWHAVVANPLSSAGQFEVKMQTILNRDDSKVVTWRISSVLPFQATVNHGSGYTSSASMRDPHTKLHTIEVTVLIDHVNSHRCVKELLTVGGAGGPSVYPVTDDYVLNDQIVIRNVGGRYHSDETVELMTWQDSTYSLSLKQ